MLYLERRVYLLFGALVSLIVAGCGGEPLYKVTGKVVDGGQPVAMPADAEEGGPGLELEFCPLDDSGNLAGDSFQTYAEQDGSFVMDGNFGDGIPAGKYRVVVRHMGENEEGDSVDLLDGKFEMENSPLEYDITGDQEITIDISKAGGSE